MIKHKSILDEQYRDDWNISSPVVDDYVPKVVPDKSGDSIVVFEKVDYPSIVASNGVAEDWSLQSLLKAGINPNFNIHTGNSTNLENAKVVERFAEAIGAEAAKSE